MTKFPTEPEPLRVYETELQRFHRGLREGRDYSGIARLKEPFFATWRQPPNEGDLLGPYTEDNYVFTPVDIEAIRGSIPPIRAASEEDLRAAGLSSLRIAEAKRRRQMGHFATELRQEVYDLFNELILSFLQHFIVPLGFPTTPSTLGLSLFPNHDHVDDRGAQHSDYYLLSRFMGAPMTVLNVRDISARIEAFVKQQADENSVALDDDTMTKLALFALDVVSELMTQANEGSIRAENFADSEDAERIIIPEHVRMAVLASDSFAILQYSRCFWQGRHAV